MPRLSLWLVCLLFSWPALANDEVLSLLKELKSQVHELQSQVNQANHRISDLESQLQQARNVQSAPVAQTITVGQAAGGGGSNSSPAPVVAANEDNKPRDKSPITVGDVKGTFKIPGTETSIGIGGFVKTDVLLSDVSAGRDRIGDQTLNLAQIPVGGAVGEHSQLAMHAKETRLWFKSFTPSAWGDINTLLEMDFLGDPGTYIYTPRLRHAYGSIGNLLAGQTWTTYLNASALPEHLDIGGSAGAVTSLRQPLVRWTQPFNVSGLAMEFQTAIESPRSRIWEPTTNGNGPIPNADNFFNTPNNERYPDLVARLNFNPDWGNVSLAALARQIRDLKTSPTLTERGLWGGGVSLAGKINTFGLDNIRFMAHYGNGEGRYVATTNTFSDASLDPLGTFELTTSYGGMLSYQHWWNKQWRSTATYGFAQADQPDYVNPVLSHQVQSLHANLLWSPINQAMLGVEYIYANRELLDGRSGELQRLQFSARYSF